MYIYARNDAGNRPGLLLVCWYAGMLVCWYAGMPVSNAGATQVGYVLL